MEMVTSPPFSDFRIVRPPRDAAQASLLAVDRALDRTVILRLVPEDPSSAAALLEVARALSRVSHPALCTVHRVVAGAASGGQRPFVVVEHARGAPLDDEGTLSEERLLAVGRALAGGLVALHAAGLAHGAVRADRVVVSAEGDARLVGLSAVRARATDGDHAADVAALGALIEARAQPELRAWVASLVRAPGLTAAGLLHALEARAAGATAASTDNPYRGLDAFDAADAPVFFGRETALQESLVRLREQPWLLVAGPPGCGKTSFVRAGIAACVARGDLGERARWDIVHVAAAADPLGELAAALAPVLGREASGFAEELRTRPATAARLARERREAGLLLVVDPLDALVVRAHDDNGRACLDALQAFGAPAPGVRAVLTLESASLPRLAALGAPGAAWLATFQLLAAPGEAELRDVIEGPARARGYAVEAGAPVGELISEAHRDPDALTLLSFAMSTIWKQRDPERRVIPAAAFTALGTAIDALARHAEVVLASLAPPARDAARRLLVRLSREGDPGGRAALCAMAGAHADAAWTSLVAGRIVVESSPCRIVHPALPSAWPRLREWVDEATAARVVAGRLRAAAREWERLDRPDEGLLGTAQLRELEATKLPETLAGVEAELFAASRAAERRRRARTIGAVVGVPLSALLVVVSVVGARQLQERRDDARFAGAHVANARAARQDAKALAKEAEALRRQAFTRYDARDWSGGEARWHDACSMAERASARFQDASTEANLALARSPRDAAVRALAADVVLEWLLAAEPTHDAALQSELATRLAALDEDGSRRAALAAPAHLTVTTRPPGAAVTLYAVHPDAEGVYVEDAGRAIPLGAAQPLAPGSYLLSAEAAERFPTRLPIVLERGEAARVEIPMPRAANVPAGATFVPGGEGLQGSRDEEALRVYLLSQPLHRVHFEPFLIGVHEVTFEEYLAFLDALPAAERAERRPQSTEVSIEYDGTLAPTLHDKHDRASAGQPLCRPGRKAHACQAWLRMPVAGVRLEDADAFAAWLSRTGVPGARLCTEPEWERAARGADGRRYAWGDKIRPEDANTEAAQGTGELAAADEVGTFLHDRSPFGVWDLTGNVSEWVSPVLDEARPRPLVARGASWATEGDRAARLDCRSDAFSIRNDDVGFRWCAPAPPVE